MQTPRTTWTRRPRSLAGILVQAATLIALVAAPGVAPSAAAKTGPAVGTVRVGADDLAVALVTSAESARLGLGERDDVARGTDGMYFRALGQPGFGMHGMRFCLDFIWIANGAVLGTTENACPAPDGAADEDIPVYYPPGDIDGAIEVRAGWVAAHGVAAADPVSAVTMPSASVTKMMTRAARDGRFDTSEVGAVADALAYAGVASDRITGRMRRVNDGNTVSARELRRLAAIVRSSFAE